MCHFYIHVYLYSIVMDPLFASHFSHSMQHSLHTPAPTVHAANKPLK